MKDIVVLERILVDHGRIVDHKTVSSYFAGLSNINNKISNLIEKGWLVNLKKGVYYISKMGSLGYAATSNYILANAIGEKSFISFEAALKYHGMFDQGLKRYRSISLKQYLSKELEEIEYSYIMVKEDNYFGSNEESVEGGMVRIASKERALLDLVEYQRTLHSVIIVIEKLQDFKDDLDIDILVNYLNNYSQVTIKTFGLIFDALHIDSSRIESLVRSNTSTSKLLETSDKFNRKWRLYFDSILEQQII